jgi:dynein heavy chain
MQIKKEHLRQLMMELEALKKKFQDIIAQQKKLQKKAQETELRLKRANDLINGLAGEIHDGKIKLRFLINYISGF